MEYTLRELLDIPKVQALLDSLNAVSCLPSAIIDMEGNALTATAWQDICTKFHLAYPDTEKKCIESTLRIGARLDESTSRITYRCPMGLVDTATPIVIEGKHYGNIFVGQLFVEPPDESYFVRQARRYGFDEDEYLAALRRVPLFSEEELQKSLNFIGNLAQMLAEQGLQALRQIEANEALRKSEERHRTILRTALSGICVIDLRGRLVEVNTAYCLKTGYSEQELLGMSISDLEANDTADDIASRIEEIRERGESHFESRHRRKDGTVIDVEVSIQYRPEDGGQFIAFLRDITERKRVEAYRRMGQDILQVLNEKESHNDAIERIIGLVKSATGVDAVGIRLQDGDDFPYFYQEGFPTEFLLKENSLLARTRDGGICRDECGDVCLDCTCGLVITGKTDPSSPLFTKGGSCWTNDSLAAPRLPADEDSRSNPRDECLHQGYASVALIPIRAKGRNVGLLQLNDRRRGCFSREAIESLEDFAENIGEAMLRKQAEEEKARLEAKLLQAQKMESVGRLAGGVAHDFNNMLSVIFGRVEMALMRLDPGQPLYSSIREIGKAAERSADLTRQLLAFARKQTVSPRVVDLNEIVAGMLTMLQRLIGENVGLRWLPGADLWPIMIDTSQVDQIMANLCVNARDAIADVGEIVIETANCSIDGEGRSAHPYVVPGDYVKIVVSDNGAGMEEEMLEQIFEPFFTTKVVGEGTGLGLATTYGIVKQNNGFIDVQSQPGSGTTFTIHLPRYEGSTEQGLKADAPEPFRVGHETILLVEDEPMILEMTAMMLAELGYTVLEAGAPSEAIRLARECAGEIHLVMTDVIMPEMNGRELARNLSSLHPRIRCLFMSGYPANVIAHHGVLDEDVHFIQKPFQMNALADKLRQVLEGR